MHLYKMRTQRYHQPRWLECNQILKLPLLGLDYKRHLNISLAVCTGINRAIVRIGHWVENRSHLSHFYLVGSHTLCTYSIQDSINLPQPSPIPFTVPARSRLGVMYLRPPTIGHSLFEIFLFSLFVIEKLDTSSFHLNCLLFPSSTFSKSYHREYVRSIDEDLVDLFNTESCGFGIEKVDRWNDASSDNCPDQVEFPAEALESDWGCHCALARFGLGRGLYLQTITKADNQCVAVEIPEAGARYRVVMTS
jgi:hypothetical protein